MRNELKFILKEHLRTRLWEIKTEQGYTQNDLAEILHMDRRTVAAILRGEHSMSSLTTALFLVRLSKDPGQELQNIMELLQDPFQPPNNKSAS